MNIFKRITSTIIAATMLLPFGSSTQSVSAQDTDKAVMASERTRKKSVDKRIVGAGITAAVGIPACVLIGCLIHHARTTSSGEPFDLNAFANKVDNSKENEVCVPYDDLISACNKVKPLLDKDGHLPRVIGPTIVVGDLHGDFKAAKFYCDEFLKRLNTNSQTNIVFLGDYIDRGKNSVEILYMLFRLKIMYPKNVYLLSGNHEGSPSLGEFFREAWSKYPSGSEAFFQNCSDVFKSLSLAAVVNDSVFCVHGGISADPQKRGEPTDPQKGEEPISLAQIENLPHCSKINCMETSTRTGDVADPNGFIVNNLWWSDFQENLQTPFSEYANMIRGNSYHFGPLAVSAFLNKNNLKKIVRGHQHPENGKAVSNDGKVITLLSAPKFCGRYTNDGYAVYFSGMNDADGNPIVEDIVCRKS